MIISVEVFQAQAIKDVIDRSAYYAKLGSGITVSRRRGKAYRQHCNVIDRYFLDVFDNQSCPGFQKSDSIVSIYAAQVFASCGRISVSQA